MSPGEKTLIEILPRPPLQGHISFNGLHIVEWLQDSPSEPQTGRELYVNIERIRPGWARYIHFDSKEDVFTAIRDARIVEGVAPILHIECHGDTLGLGNGASSEEILWDELRPLLQGLNLASKCNLLVFIAACEGFAGIKALTGGPIAPAAALIGPAAPIDTVQLAAATNSFYSGLASGNAHLQTMVDAMTAQCGVRFEPEPMALLMFEAMIERMVVDSRSQNRDGRMNRMRQRLSEQGLGAAELENAMARFEKTMAKAAQQVWDTFFMLDRYPENASRFGLDVIGIAQRIAAFRGRAL